MDSIGMESVNDDSLCMESNEDSDSDTNSSSDSFGFPHRVKITEDEMTYLSPDKWREKWKEQAAYIDFLETRCNALQDLLLNCDRQEEDIKDKKNYKKSSTNKHKLHTCPECGKQFRYVALLKRHHLTHTGEKPYSCEQCDKAFTTRSYLRLHKNAIHEEDKPHQCTQCGKRFSKTRGLYQHIQFTHVGERPFACTECDKTYGDKHALYEHLRSHTGERPYRCDICGKAYGRSSHLRRHQKTNKGCSPSELQPVESRSHQLLRPAPQEPPMGPFATVGLQLSTQTLPRSHIHDLPNHA